MTLPDINPRLANSKVESNRSALDHHDKSNFSLVRPGKSFHRDVSQRHTRVKSTLDNYNKITTGRESSPYIEVRKQREELYRQLKSVSTDIKLPVRRNL